MRHRARVIAALGAIACLLASPSALPQSAEPSSEQQAFNNACRTCHVTREGDNRLGPNLHKIVGRKAGSLPDYNYSSSMKEADFVWDEAKLDRFIANPDEVVAGNKMKPYSGLTNKEDREKIVAFLAKAQ
jgi:cytochrome c